LHNIYQHFLLPLATLPHILVNNNLNILTDLSSSTKYFTGLIPHKTAQLLCHRVTFVISQSQVNLLTRLPIKSAPKSLKILGT